MRVEGKRAPMPPKSDNTWKLLSAIFLNAALFVVAPYALSGFGLIGKVHSDSWLILTVTAVGLIFKILFGDVISGEFLYYKHGYDFCVLTLGASLSSFALQLVSEKDLFPGLKGNSFLEPIAHLTDDTKSQRLILLGLVVLTSCLIALLTARIGKSIKEGTARFSNLLSAMNFTFGCGLFAVYVMMLISKG
jgi:hypothetical protein